MLWNDAADDLLIKLWDEGGSLAYVAQGMKDAGYVVSRNSIAGRRYRLPDEAFKRRGVAPPVKTAAPVKKRSPRTRSKPAVKVSPRKPVTVEEVNVIAQHVGIEYLENDSFGCKAIMPTRGGPWALQRVCGKPRGPDYNGCLSSYCPTHFRMFTNPIPLPRKQHG